MADEDKPFLRQILAYYVSLYKPEYLFATCEDDNARIQRAGKVEQGYGGGGEREQILTRLSANCGTPPISEFYVAH